MIRIIITTLGELFVVLLLIGAAVLIASI